jgi:hypothetical protein
LTNIQGRTKPFGVPEIRRILLRASSVLVASPKVSPSFFVDPADIRSDGQRYHPLSSGAAIGGFHTFSYRSRCRRLDLASPTATGSRNSGHRRDLDRLARHDTSEKGDVQYEHEVSRHCY